MFYIKDVLMTFLYILSEVFLKQDIIVLLHLTC